MGNDIELVSSKKIRQIRAHIGRIEKQAALLENIKKWLQITSALDALEDSASAIKYYVDTDFPTQLGGQYLSVYGLLQALFIQQDCVSSIQDALFEKPVDFKVDYPAAYTVREYRNDVVGHPSGRGSGTSFSYLAQCSLSKQGFYYVREYSGETPNETRNVTLLKAIDDSSKCVNSVLDNAISLLNDEFEKYIEKHRGRKMKDIFASLHYAKENVLTRDGLPLSGFWYNETKKMVEKCEQELVMRYGSVSAQDSFKYLLDEIHELYILIDDGLSKIPPEIQAQSRKFFLQCLFSKLDELESDCTEIDLYFENYGDNK